jgi:hypothetical protein
MKPMKIEVIPQHQIADIQKLTGVPSDKVSAAISQMGCSFERFRHFCLNQGVLPSQNQQVVLSDQEQKGHPYDFPTDRMIDAYIRQVKKELKPFTRKLATNKKSLWKQNKTL